MLSLFNFNLLHSDEKVDAIVDQIQIISQDLKTLEKAFYKNSDVIDKSKTSNFNNLNEDVLTKHLLRLNEIEEQFRELTNKFEEVNFKMDKLSTRVTKMQSDNQMRFSDLENIDPKQTKDKKKAKLPGTSKPQDFGATPGYSSTIAFIFSSNSGVFLLTLKYNSVSSDSSAKKVLFSRSTKNSAGG